MAAIRPLRVYATYLELPLALELGALLPCEVYRLEIEASLGSPIRLNFREPAGNSAPTESPDGEAVLSSTATSRCAATRLTRLNELGEFYIVWIGVESDNVDEFHICFRDIPEAFSTGCQFWHRAGGDRLHSNLSRFFRI